MRRAQHNTALDSRASLERRGEVSDVLLTDLQYVIRARCLRSKRVSGVRNVGIHH